MTNPTRTRPRRRSWIRRHLKRDLTRDEVMDVLAQIGAVGGDSGGDLDEAEVDEDCLVGFIERGSGECLGRSLPR